jgi:hypothetical protein
MTILTLKASDYGLVIADRARRQKGWLKSQGEWIESANVAPASLRRFWLKQPIKRKSFLAICQAVGIDWEEIADGETTADLPSAILKMKRLYTRAAELNIEQIEQEADLDEETINSLCRGWLFELFALMVKAAETADPDKTFLQLTLDLIHRIGTLFESFHEEEKTGCYVKVTVRDEAGALHDVTGLFAEREINIRQIHIVPDEPKIAVLNIYCEKICDRKTENFEKSLRKLSRVIRAEVRSIGGES